MATATDGETTASIDTDQLVSDVYRILGNQNTILKQLEVERDQLLEDARALWPVRSGKSKDGLVGFETITPDGVMVGIRDDVPYVYYIKGNAQGGRSTWVELVRSPMTKRVKKIHNELADDLIRIASK